MDFITVDDFSLTVNEAKNSIGFLFNKTVEFIIPSQD
jgi:hypothetical protein